MIADELLDKIDQKQSPCVVGLDPVLERIPKHLLSGNSFDDAASAILKFNKGIIDAISDLVPAVKLQLAFYEKYGAAGVIAFKDTAAYAREKGLIVIADGKRNDISSTAAAYADTYLGEVNGQSAFDIDFLTVTPYIGSDGIDPFVDVCKKNGKGIFVLVKTSNPSSGQVQDRIVELSQDEQKELGAQKTELYNILALLVKKYSENSRGERGYSFVGAVVGATYPEQASKLRKIMPSSIFLVPGYGAQGGTAKDIVPCFNDDGYGAIVSSSRGIIYAYEKTQGDFAEAAKSAAEKMNSEILIALKDAGKLPEKWN